MAAKDLYHEHVRAALKKDGWTITDEPLSLEWMETTLQIDFGAERLITAEKGKEKIAVEVKSSVGPSKIEDLRDALAQFIIYRLSLKRKRPNHILFIAIRDDVYRRIFETSDGKLLLAEEQVRLLVFNVRKKEIVKWISWTDIATS